MMPFPVAACDKGSQSSVRRYLVVAPQGLGDSLEATPFLQALRASEADAKIHVAVTRPAARELFTGLSPLVDRVLYLPYWERGPIAFAGSLVAHKLWSPRYDAAFLMYPAARAEYHALMRAFPARRRFAHRYWPSRRRALQWLNTDLVEVRRAHNVLRNLDLLEAAGIPHDVPPTYAVPGAWIAPREYRRPDRIAMHVGTIAHGGLESRRWPLEYFARVAESLLAHHYDVTAISGPAERRETRRLQELVPHVHLFEGSLSDTARFLSTARLSVTNDSGIGHLAAAVGTHVVALFGPTPLEHAPYGSNVTALRPSPCPPCFDVRLLNTQCALNIDYACLKRDLTPDYVVNCISGILERRSSTIAGETAKSASNAVDSASAT